MFLTEFPKGRGTPSRVAKEDPPPFNGRRVKQLNKTNTTRPDHEREDRVAVESLASIDFLGDGSMKNPIEFREWFKILFRVWRPNLSPNEFLVAQFIFDRTAGWGKEWEVIRPDHFLSGVVGKDGKIYASGLVMTPPTLRKCLASLIERGAIRMIQEKRKKAYALNYEWNPDEIENYATMPMPLPKRLKNLQELQTGDSVEKENYFPKNQEKENDFLSKRKISFNLNKKRKEKGYAKEERSTDENASRLCHASHGERLLQVAKDLDKEKRKSAEKRKNKIVEWRSTSAAYKAWFDLCESFHPDANHLAVTKTDTLILHRYGLRFATASKNSSLPNWIEFLSWVIERWHTIREFHFAWMKANSPAVPSIRFLVKFGETFEQAWASKQDVEHFATLSTRDREVELRVLKGVDRTVAEQEVDKRLGLITLKQEIESASAKLKKQQASFENARRDHAIAEVRKAKWKELRTKSSVTEGEGTFDQWE
jgi:hypothetical protein